MTEAAASDPPTGRSRTVRLPSDDRLAKRAAEGDEDAFAAIYDRYHQDLYRFCLAIVRSPQDAQDALQNAMVKVLRALPGETRRIQLKPWLYRIAHNEAIELLRKRRDSVAIEPELTASGAELAEAAATRERLRRLLADLAELPGRQRAALVMRELAGLGFGEIGAAFDTSDAVARQTVYEARLSLRQMEAGREMSCKKVMWELSEADGRVARRRDIQAHLRACPECRAFRDEIAGRRDDFAAIAPLPLAVSAGLLHGLLGGSAAAAAGAGAAGAGAGTGAAGTVAAGGAGAAAGAGGGLAGAAAGAGSAVATSAVLKAAATVAVVAAGVTAADRGGLIETPLPSSVGGTKSSGPTPGAAPAPGTPARSGGEATTEASEAGAPGRGERRGGPAAEREAKAEGAGKAAKGRSGRSGNGPGAVPGGKDANGRSQAKGHGRPESLPAASGHGQGKAPANSGGKSKGSGSKGVEQKGGGSKGGGKSKARPPRKSRPTRGSKAGPRAHGPPTGEVGPDKAQDVPFKPPEPEVSKSATSTKGSANPSKEAR